MKVVIFACAIFALAAALPQHQQSGQYVQHQQSGQYVQQQVPQHHVQHQQSGQYVHHNNVPATQHHHDVDSSRQAKLVRYNSELGLGAEGYKYGVETSDGVVKEEQGVFENAGTEDESLKVVGRFSYPGGPNGELLTVEYVADKNGFQPSGAHLH